MTIKNFLKKRKNLSFVVIILCIFCLIIGYMIYGSRNVNAYSYSVSSDCMHRDSNNYHYRYFKYRDALTGEIDHSELRIIINPTAADAALKRSVYDDASRSVTITATSDVVSGDDVFSPYLSDADGNKVSSYTCSTILDATEKYYTNVVYYVTYTVPAHSSWDSTSIDRPLFSGSYAAFSQTGVIGHKNHSSASHKYTIKCNVNLQNVGVMDGIDGKRYWGTSSTDMYFNEIFTVSFMTNDGSSDCSTKSVCDGEAYDDLPAIQRDGYSFDGWYTDASGGSKIYSNSIACQDITTLYAHWSEETYTVSYHSNGGSGKLSNRSYAVGESFILPDVGFIRSNYTLIGWCMDEYGKSTVYKIGESVSNLGLADSTVNLYAIWQRNGSGFIQRPLLDADMFHGNYSIRGQNGTTYNSEYTDSRYAHIDQHDNPGYFSKK